MELHDEKQLIERAKTDPVAFGELFEKYYSPILHYVLKRVGIVQLAEDITSQVFFLVLKKLWQFQWRNIPFSAWIYRIAINEIHQYFRKNKYVSVSLEALIEANLWEPVGTCDLLEEMRVAESTFDDHKDFLVIQRELFHLPLKYQEVLSLKYFENKKTREIALILRKNENTIKSLIKRGLALLKDKFNYQKNMQPISPSSISEYE